MMMSEFDAGAESGHTHWNLAGNSDGWWENWQTDTKGTTPLSDYDLIQRSVCVCGQGYHYCDWGKKKR